MRKSGTHFLVYLSLFAFLLTLVAIPLSHYSEAWETFAIYSQRPVFYYGDMEFGWLYPAHPYVVRGWLRVEGLNAREHWPQPPAVVTQREYVWQCGGVIVTRGLLIPPWGWGIPPIQDKQVGLTSAIGDLPTTVIPFLMFRVPLVYGALLFALLPAWHYVRRAKRGRS